VGKPSMDVYAVRPYHPGEEQDYHLQQNPELRSENSDTTYMVLTSNYHQEGDDRGVITRSWALRNDGLLQTWETWRKWEKSQGWGGNVDFSRMIPNDPENTPDLWNKVISAVRKPE